MAREVLLVTHAADETDDRASAWLAARGFDVRWVHPAAGDEVPRLDDRHAAVVVYGGRYDVEPKDAAPFLREECRLIEQAMAADVPLLGFCLGAQLMADVLGQPVGPHPGGFAEYGYYPLVVSDEGRDIFGDGLTVLESHWHGWYETPRGAVHLASSEHFPQQAFRYGRNAYAFQFHPETSFETMARWVGRRGERNFLPGAFPPDRQLADHAVYDGELGGWLEGFMERWIAPVQPASQAAE